VDPGDEGAHNPPNGEIVSGNDDLDEDSASYRCSSSNGDELDLSDEDTSSASDEDLEANESDAFKMTDNDGDNQSIGDQGVDQEPEDLLMVEMVDDSNEGHTEVRTSTGYNLCQRKERTDDFASAINAPHSSKSYYPPHQFVHAKALAEHPSETELQKFVFGFVFAQMLESAKGMGHEQMSAKASIKKHGRRAEEALMAKFMQLEDLSVFKGINLRTLMGKQKEPLCVQST
jgi:hypothetical protein